MRATRRKGQTARLICRWHCGTTVFAIVSPKATGGDAGDRVRHDQGQGPRSRRRPGTILSVVPDTDIHPELRSAARFVPSKAHLPVDAAGAAPLTALQRPSGDGVELLTLSSGIGIRLHRPRNGTVRGPAPAVDTRWRLCAGTSPAQDDILCRRFADTLASRSPRCATGWRPSIPTPRRWRTVTARCGGWPGCPPSTRPDRHRR